jgi:hypothetical protein
LPFRITKYCKIILHQYLYKNLEICVTKCCKIIVHQQFCNNLPCRIPKCSKINLHQHLCHKVQSRILTSITIYDHSRLKNRGPMLLIPVCLSTDRLIPRSLQLHVQLILASLGWCHKSGECTKSCASISVCFCYQSGGVASIDGHTLIAAGS